MLALYFGEPGAEAVERVVLGSLLSAVNYTEVVSKALDRGDALPRIFRKLAAMGFSVVPHDQPLARRAGELRPRTRHLGLSLADRACIALAERERLPAFTADRSWLSLGGAVAIEVHVIR